MKDNTILMVLLIVFLFSIMCKNRKENFSEDLSENCNCQDRWYFWAPRSVDGIDNNNKKHAILFKGCDNNIELANPTQKKWCYTKGPCPQNEDSSSDSYQPFGAGVNSGTVNTPKGTQGTNWRRCKQTKFKDEDDIINKKFNELSSKIALLQCQGKTGKHDTCLGNFNKCIPNCFKNSIEDKKGLINDLTPILKCAEGLRVGNSSNCSQDILAGLPTNPQNIGNYINSLILSNAVKYQNFGSDECLNADKPLFVDNVNCCKRDKTCTNFLMNEFSPTGEKSGIIVSKCQKVLEEKGGITNLASCNA